MTDLVKSNQSVADTIQQLTSQPAIKSRFNEILGKRAPQFISSIISIVNADQNLQAVFKDNPMSVLQVAMKAAIYNLPLGNDMGLAYILPFKNYKTGKPDAQFIISYKGYIELALRTGRYKRLGACDVRQGELKHIDYLNGEIEFDFIQDPIARRKIPIIGYAATLQLIEGFERQIFMTLEEINEHEVKNRRGQYQSKVWKDTFDVMAMKTVLLRLIKTYAPRIPEDRDATDLEEIFENNEVTDDLPPDPIYEVPPDINEETGEIG